VQIGSSVSQMPISLVTSPFLAILDHIGSVPVDLSEDASAPAPDLEAVPVGLKIFQPEENTLDKEQARQLGQHLIRWRAELEAAQANLEEKRIHAYRQQEVDQQEIARRHLGKIPRFTRTAVKVPGRNARLAVCDCLANAFFG